MHWYFLPRLKPLFEFTYIVPGDDETFILAIESVTFLLLTVQQVPSHSLPRVLEGS